MADRLVSVDSETLRFPDVVADRLASDAEDRATGLGAAVDRVARRAPFEPVGLSEETLGKVEPAGLSEVTQAQLSATYATQGLPAEVGPRAGVFDSRESLYLPYGASLGGVRSKIMAGASGASYEKIAYVGTSIVVGYGGTPGVTSPPVQLRNLIGRQYGAVGDGLAATNNAVPSDPDDVRYTYDPAVWTYTGGAYGGGNVWFHRQSAGGAGSSPMTFKSKVAGSIVEIYTFGNTGNFTYSVDGGAPATYTRSGIAQMVKLQVTGLADTTHQVTVTPSSGTTVFVLGITVRPATGLEVGSFGYYGSSTPDWLPTATSGNAWSPYKVVSGYDPSVVLIQLGANEAIHALGVPLLATNLQTIASSFQGEGREVVLIVDPPIESSTITNWATDFRSAIYDVADDCQVPLIDLTHAWGNRTQAAAWGYYFDQWHHTPAGAMSIANVVMSALT